MKKRKRNKHNRLGTLSITVVVVMLFSVLSMKSMELQAKNKEYVVQESQLKEQLQTETDRKKDIEEYEKYTQTTAFVEEIAKEKLGLVYPDEIIFKSDNK